MLCVCTVRSNLLRTYICMSGFAPIYFSSDTFCDADPDRWNREPVHPASPRLS